MHTEGETQVTIAKALGRNKGAIGSRLKKLREQGVID
jgi:DNA-binding Lrp family transcriptional regulator